jgi:basic membrane protein A
MFQKRLLYITGILVLCALLVSACGSAAQTSEPMEEEVVAEEPEAEEPEAEEEIMAEKPTELRVAALLSSTADNPWDESFLMSFQEVQEAAPYGLTISDIDFSEGVWGDEAGVVLREYASTGEYDIIWAHSAYSDQVKVLKDEYPEIVWVVAGSGNEPIGDNAYWIFLHVHEVTYLMGRYAGGLTESNVIGLVAGFETDDTLDTFNGFVDGAKSVNPDITTKVSYIESWYDPAKGAEAARAQIAAGADQIYTQSYGFEACVEADIFCYSTYTDNNYLATENILVSALSYWNPHINYIIDEWWNHETDGMPYDAPMEAVWFNMAEGTGDLSSLHGLDEGLPAEVIADVEQAREDILNGTLQVELKVEPISSD